MADKRICAYDKCKKLFQPYGNAKFCSTKCRYEVLKLKDALKPKPCKWCGTLTTDKSKLCSTACTIAYNNAHAKSKKKSAQNNSELARINKLARETGLSYGKYVGKMYARGIKIL